MLDALFYIFAGITLLASVCIVTSRNPVNAAMFMIVAFLGTGLLFFLLEAFLLGALQILVYAGAVVVLFLFIIMLLNVDKMSLSQPKGLPLAAAMICLGLMLAGVVAAFLSGQFPMPGEPTVDTAASSVRNFGVALFTQYLLPFELTGLLLLIAMIGVIYLSRKPTDPPKPTETREESNA